MSEPTRIILLSGFLGSGKTTLLKHIMALDTDMSDTVILMNEFGEVGIDGMLLKHIGTDVVELTSGCICCSMSDDLIETLEEVLHRYAPRKIIIEATGIADPQSVTAVLKNSDLLNKVQIHKIITVMDAQCWEVRDVFGTLFFRQLEQADTIIFNKIDLLSKDEISRHLTDMHRAIPGAQIVPALECKVEPDIVWLKPVFKNLQLPVSATGDSSCDCLTHSACRHQDHFLESGYPHEKIYAGTDFVTFSFVVSEPLDEAALKRFVREAPFELFRIKGVVNFGDRSMLINAVGGKIDWRSWETTSETRLACVGWNINPDEYLTKLQACVRT